jgi:hypothetical protein
MAELARLLEDGTLIRGEVVSRWQDFVGTGQLLQVLAESTSKIRRWLRTVFGGSPKVEQVEREARSELVDAVVRRTDLAATAAAGAWELDTAGAELLAETSGVLWRHAPETPGRAERAIADWLGYLTKLIEEEGGDRKRLAQVASYGVNAAAVTVLLGVFVHTGGLTGAELGVTASAAAAQQKVLEHVFGSAAARTLIAKAKERLYQALHGVLHTDGARFYELTAERSVTRESGERVRELAARVQQQATAYRD